ncbi:hypothetical protein A9Q96_09545 [Rhodobacterales bacterium 52_120_T64]|nr:hypothetical protein A9Q96_09545 [Rhodobacterales bacterium 52_120_T64]
MYFSKNEEKTMEDFLGAQGLDEKQLVSVKIYFKEKITSGINLWTGITGSIAFAGGFMIALTFFG